MIESVQKKAKDLCKIASESQSKVKESLLQIDHLKDSVSANKQKVDAECKIMVSTNGELYKVEFQHLKDKMISVTNLC